MTTNTRIRKPFYVYCNMGAAILHLINSIFMIVLLSIFGSVEYTLTQSFQEWEIQFAPAESEAVQL